MLHELIDPKRKTVKTIPVRNTKTVKDIKPTYTENIITFETNDNDNKQVESASTTFFPPWLRNSLGLTQRNNQNNVISDQKPVRTIPSFKESNHNDLDNLKTNATQESCKRIPGHFENCIGEICINEVTGSRSQEVLNSPSNNDDKKTVPLFWNRSLKESEVESNAEIKLSKGNNSKTSNSDVKPSEIDQIKEEEKRRLKLIRQKSRMRKRMSEQNKNEVDLFLEMKAKQVLDNYTKKDIHTVTSEMKQLEAQLILLSAKCHGVDSKLTQQEIRFLQEIKNQVGNEETFNKIIEHLKEINLREMLRNSEHDPPKGGGDKASSDQKDEKNMIQSNRSFEEGNKSIPDKDSVISTDDENDIKRFSEFLSKNKNMDEKRKCLEEVRNYFERKRRTRLTKRRYIDEIRIQKTNIPMERRDDNIKEKIKIREGSISPRERKTKFDLIEEEVVEKAVDETLQKFIDIYHFRVTPTMMGNMRKNILEAIHSDSLKSRPSVGNFTDRQEMSPREKSSQKLMSRDGKHKYQRKCFTDDETQMNREPLENIQKNIPVKILMEPKGETKPPKDIPQTEDLKRLKKEFDCFLNSLQANTLVSDLKIQSVILEKEEQQSAKTLQFVYNFRKKALEPVKIDSETTAPVDKLKETGVQTLLKVEPSKRSLKIQTTGCDVCDASVQTEEKSYVSVDAQTEKLNVKELKELSFTDVSPGLYRMMKSKEPGKFYLYPENLESKMEKTLSSTEFNISDLEARLDTSDILSPFLDKSLDTQTHTIEKVSLKQQNSKKSNLSVTTTKPEEENTQTPKMSVNCLYFRPSDKTDSPDGTTLEEVKSEKIEKVTTETQVDHSGCVWFWNGEKIYPGSDLKSHVENLLIEKLKEITISIENHNEKQKVQEKISKVKSEVTEDVSNVLKSRSFVMDKLGILNEDLESKQTVFCYRAETDTPKEMLPFLISVQSSTFDEKIEVQEGKGISETTVTEVNLVPKEEKTVKDVGIQNSQQTCCSLNVSKIKPRSKTVTKIKTGKKNSGLLKQFSDTQQNVINFKKMTEALRFLQELKKIKSENKKTGMGEEVTGDSSSTVEDSLCSSGPMTCCEDPLAFLFEFHKKPEEEQVAAPSSMDTDMRSKIEKIISVMNNENQNTYEDEVEPCVEKTTEHWGFMESILSRVNHKERESLWNDIRHLVKAKLGKDINDENTKEVCIEIEQDLPEDEEEKIKQQAFARGHYSKNEGDVEVEIDLTLDDLERILRHRQKKIRKRQMNRPRKFKKLSSSSSTHEDIPKEEIRKYLDMFTALGRGVVPEKDVKNFIKN